MNCQLRLKCSIKKIVRIHLNIQSLTHCILCKSYMNSNKFCIKYLKCD